MDRRFICTREGCTRSLFRRGLCHGHYDRETGRRPADKPIEERKRLGAFCEAPGCQRKPKALGVCMTHWERKHRGDPEWDRPIEAGKQNLCRPLNVRLKRFAVDALLRRSKATRVPVATLLRAMVERWAMTEGAATREEHDAHEEAAWKRNGSEMGWDH